jgi:glycosyltransferase involved in cell wall biosynthesis
MSEFLTISIPTRNRATYLADLLVSIANQWKEEYKDVIKIQVLNNRSEDKTDEIVNAGCYPFDIYYMIQPNKLDGDESIASAYNNSFGEYTWVCGDDELLPENSLSVTLELLYKYKPALLLPKDLNYVGTVKLDEYYPNYKEFAKYCYKTDKSILVAHSLISGNIVKTELFDTKIAEEKRKTNYGHFYGIINGVGNSDLPLICPQVPTLTVRLQRAFPVDGLWSEDLEQKQKQYLEWVCEKFNLKGEN